MKPHSSLWEGGIFPCFRCLGWETQSHKKTWKIFNSWKTIEDNSIGLQIHHYCPMMTDLYHIWHILTDDVFLMRTKLMKPYRRANFTHRPKIFNYRLSCGRRIVGNAFGILASRWQCLARIMLQMHSVVMSVIPACICLHNVFRMRYANLDRGQMNVEDEAHNILPGAWKDEAHMEEYWGQDYLGTCIHGLIDVLNLYKSATHIVNLYRFDGGHSNVKFK